MPLWQDRLFIGLRAHRVRRDGVFPDPDRPRRRDRHAGRGVTGRRRERPAPRCSRQPARAALFAARKSRTDVGVRPDRAATSPVTVARSPARVAVSKETSVGMIGLGNARRLHAAGELLVGQVDDLDRLADDARGEGGDFVIAEGFGAGQRVGRAARRAGWRAHRRSRPRCRRGRRRRSCRLPAEVYHWPDFSAFGRLMNRFSAYQLLRKIR